MKIQVEKTYTIKAEIARVWEVISDLSNDGVFWQNIRNIRVIRQEKNLVVREATVGPRAFGALTTQYITLEPPSRIQTRLEGSTVNGERLIMARDTEKGETVVDVCWNLEFEKIPEFIGNIIAGQLSKATDEALSLIGREVLKD